MKDLKIEISLRDLILYVIVIVLFIWGFLKFQTYELEIGLAQRHGLISQNDQNVQILDKKIIELERRIIQLEALNKAPTDAFPRLEQGIKK